MGTSIPMTHVLVLHANAAAIAAMDAEVGSDWRAACWRAVEVAEHYDNLWPQYTTGPSEQKRIDAIVAAGATPIEDHRPGMFHTVEMLNGNVSVLPDELILGWINGDVSLITLSDDMIKTIIADWRLYRVAGVECST